MRPLALPHLFLACLLAGLTVLAPARAADPPRTDAHGDPLPEGALARLGTIRWRADGPIALAAFLPDGKSVLTVSQDRVAQVWDRDSGKELRHFDAAGPASTDPNAVRMVLINGSGLVLSGDGKTLASLGRDGLVHLWDVGTGKETAKLADDQTAGRHTAGRVQFALSADGKTLVTAVYGQKTVVWDTTTGKEVRSFGAPTADGRLMPYHMSLSPDGKRLVQAGIEPLRGAAQTSVVVWDATTGKVARRVSDPDFGTGGLPAMMSAFSPDAKLLAVPVRAKVKLIDLATGKVARELDGGDEDSPLTFSPDGKLLVALHGRGERLTVWDVATGKKLRDVGKAQAPAATAAALRLIRYGAGSSVSPDGKLLAWGDGPALRLTDLETGKEKNGTAGHADAARELLFGRDGKTVLTAGDDGTLRRWDAATGKELSQVALPGSTYAYVLPSPDGRVVAACDPTGTIHLIDADTGKEKHAIALAQAGYGGAVAFSPDSRRLASVSMVAQSVELFDVSDGKVKQSLALPSALEATPGFGIGVGRARAPRRVLFSPDGRHLAVTDRNLVLFDVPAGRQERQIELPQGGMIRYAVYSPDGRAIAVESNGGQIDVWEAATGQKRLSFNTRARPDPSRVQGGIAVGGRLVVSNPVTLAFSPDGRLLAQADGNAARLWDLYTGKEVVAFDGHRGPIAGLAFAPRGRRLATSSADTTALVWDTEPAVKKLSPLAAPLTKNDLEAAWTALGEGDGGKGYEAVRRLAGNPAKAVPFLAERVKPVAAPDPERMKKLIADLDADEFDVRESARKDLEKLGELALAAAREALKGRPSAEQRRSLEEVVKEAAAPSASGERLRLMRALEALEMAHTPEAVKLLKDVAGGAPDTLPTTQARASLTRLGVK